MQTNRSAVNDDFSLYLDFVRFLAASFVVVMHMVMAGLVSADVAAHVPVLGREAVIAFFVLSGFVIMYSVDKQRNTLKEYVVARCARIYSVVLPALLLSFTLAGLLSESPAAAGTYQVVRPHVYIPLHLAFMGEAWNLSETPPWLAPYWSLGYEVWYYVIFGVAYFGTGQRRIALVGAILLTVGFKLWLLFPVWLSGAWLYRWLKWNSVPPAWSRVGWCLSLVALCAYKVLDADLVLRAYGISIWPFAALRLGSADRYLADYVVCALVLANFACAANMRFPTLLRFAMPIRALARYTFTLYLIHSLVLAVWKEFYPHDATSIADILLLVLAVGAATYMAGFLTERRKDALKPVFRALYERVIRLWAASAAVFQR